MLKAQEKASETDIKAAFVYNFAKFVEWPASVFQRSDSTFRIGVVGNSVMNRALKVVVEDKQLAGRRIDVVESGDARILADCQIVFFNQPSNASHESLLKDLEGHPVLTIGDPTDFITQGGMIRFIITDGRVRFEISPAKVRTEKLEISSKLLKLAIVTDKPGGTK